MKRSKILVLVTGIEIFDLSIASRPSPTKSTILCKRGRCPLTLPLRTVAVMLESRILSHPTLHLSPVTTLMLDTPSSQGTFTGHPQSIWTFQRGIARALYTLSDIAKAMLGMIPVELAMASLNLMFSEVHGSVVE